MNDNNELEIGNLTSYIYSKNIEVFNAYMDLLARESTLDENLFNIFYNLLIDLLDKNEESTNRYIKMCQSDMFFARVGRVLFNDKKIQLAIDKLIPNYLESLKNDIFLIDLVDTFLSKIDVLNNKQDLSDVYLILCFIGINQKERYEKYLEQFEFYYDMNGSIPQDYRIKDFTKSDLTNFTKNYVNDLIIKKI